MLLHHLKEFSFKKRMLQKVVVQYCQILWKHQLVIRRKIRIDSSSPQIKIDKRETEEWKQETLQCCFIERRKKAPIVVETSAAWPGHHLLIRKRTSFNMSGYAMIIFHAEGCDLSTKLSSCQFEKRKQIMFFKLLSFWSHCDLMTWVSRRKENVMSCL